MTPKEQQLKNLLEEFVKFLDSVQFLTDRDTERASKLDQKARELFQPATQFEFNKPTDFKGN